jgi:hypothetical protein
LVAIADVDVETAQLDASQQQIDQWIDEWKAVMQRP